MSKMLFFKVSHENALKGDLIICECGHRPNNHFEWDERSCAHCPCKKLRLRARWGSLITEEEMTKAKDIQTSPTEQHKHCDDYIHDVTAPRVLRFFLLINRLPAADSALCREFGVEPVLYATYDGKRVRVSMASRMGDVGITNRLDDLRGGYDKRVWIDQLSEFSATKTKEE